MKTDSPGTVGCGLYKTFLRELPKTAKAFAQARFVRLFR